MPNATLKKTDGQAAGSVVLSDRIFGAKVDRNLMHLAVQVERTNSRQDTRSTKTRGVVTGGGRKPYRQKGTGRARQGSITAPHYRHGGIVFGPHPRDLSAKLPKKARRAAILSALSAKAEAGVIHVLDTLSFDAISTKTAAGMLKTLELTGRVLIILPEHNPTIYKSFRNIPGVEVRIAPAFSVQDVLVANSVVIVRAALETLEAVWTSGSKTSEEVAAK
jgi:large subunit ribosomal protein L4